MNLLRLQNANKLYKKKSWIASYKAYLDIYFNVNIPVNVSQNIFSIRKKLDEPPARISECKVGIFCWNIGNNAACRAFRLFELYSNFSDPRLIGLLLRYRKHEENVWPPLLNHSSKFLLIEAEDQSSLIKNIIDFVINNQFDVLHISKNTPHGVLFGALYKVIWRAKVFFDIDDNEISFAKTSVVIDEKSIDFETVDWMRRAENLTLEFDGVTVVNSVLEKKFGGTIIKHPRSKEKIIDKEYLREIKIRINFKEQDKIILFLGTPRLHKGLLSVVNILKDIGDKNNILLIVGDFNDLEFKNKLIDVGGDNLKFIESQSIDKIDSILSLANCIILDQDVNSDISKYQTPAKLTDALKMSIPVLVSKSAPLEEFIDAGVVEVIDLNNCRELLISILQKPLGANFDGRIYFEKELSCNVNSLKLLSLIENARNSNIPSEKVLKFLNYLYPNNDFRIFIKPLNLFDSSTGIKEKKPTVTTSSTIELHRGNEDTIKKQKKIRKINKTVLVITWDVGHNPLGRSYMLAEAISKVVRNVVIVGFQYKRYGQQVWEPLRNSKIPIIEFENNDLSDFFPKIEDITRRYKPDLVVSCKARLPSVLLGFLFREKYGCPLIIDVDDHELSFFKEKSEVNLTDLDSMKRGSLKNQLEPYEEIWTRFSQSLIKYSDITLVSNKALQKVFGGVILPHVRNEEHFDPSKINKNKSRNFYGIGSDYKIVLFFGTPRIHKGLDVLAKTIAELDEHVRLLIVGTAPDKSVVSKLKELSKNKVIFIDNQPFEKIPEILSLADVVCLPQDINHPVSMYQLPAKAIDAISMGVKLLTTKTPPLENLIDSGIAIEINEKTIKYEIQSALESADDPKYAEMARSCFLNNYSYNFAGELLFDIFNKLLRKNSIRYSPRISHIKKSIFNSCGIGLDTIETESIDGGIDIVLFWKQNDTCLYGRRHDMVIKYLNSRSDVRKVVVFDAPISEYDLTKVHDDGSIVNQNKWIYKETYKKVFGQRDNDKVSYYTYIMTPGVYSNDPDSKDKPYLNRGYIPFIEDVLRFEGVASSDSIFWVYPKYFPIHEIIDYFKPLKVVSDVVDDHRSWPGTKQSEINKLNSHYRDLLLKSDYVLSNCESVQASMSEFHSNVHLIPNGCDTDFSVNEKIVSDIHRVCRELKGWNNKIVGFVGNLESKIDIELIEYVSSKMSETMFILVGSTHANPQVLSLSKHKNILLPGVVPYVDVSSWISTFNVGVVPHLRTDMTHSMNPLKVFVYLSHGIPVVSTDVPNVDDGCPDLHISKTYDEFLINLNLIINDNTPFKFKSWEYVFENSWSSRFKDFCNNVLGCKINE